MLASLALSAALLATPTVHHFEVSPIQNQANFNEVTIQVDPTTGIQAGWLGIQNYGKQDLVQIGWGNDGWGVMAFYQVWQNGVITDTGWIDPAQPLVPGSNLTVAITTNGRGQFLTWIKLNGKWTIPWMGQNVLTPKTGSWVVATESQGTAAVPVLNYRMGE